MTGWWSWAVSKRQVFRIILGITLMIIALYSLSFFLSRFAPVTSRFILWLALDVIALTFGIGFMLMFGLLRIANLRKIAEVFSILVIWSLIIPAPLPEEIHDVVISLSGLLVVLCYVMYTRRTKREDGK